MQKHAGPLLKNTARVLNDVDKRCFFKTEQLQGGVSSVPGTSSAPSTTVPTSYSYLSDMIKTIASKVELPLNYLGVGTSKPEAKAETQSAKSKTEVIKTIIEKRVSRTEVTNKTRALVKKILVAESTQSRLSRISELSQHIMAFPPTRVIAAQESRLIGELFGMMMSPPEEALRDEARQCLTLIGVQPPPRGKGVNVLTIDGGGTRGMMGLEVLEQIERMSGKKICELFDMICGVSTGGIVAALLTVKRFTVKECREMYMDISKKLFSQGKFQGGLGLLTAHSYYNTRLWIQILKEIIGEDLKLIHTSRRRDTPRLAIVASIVNLPTIQPYIFRNYEHPAGRDSHYRGGTDNHLWTAIQASAAAPLYFSEVKLGDLLLQDGGVFANNPTSIAMHETKLLWPHEPIHCVVSVGNGRTVMQPEAATALTSTSIQAKLMRIIDSATDTEGVHMSMHDLLDQATYYRFNPYMTYAYGLDEIDGERLEQMSNDAKLYVRRNSQKIEGAALRLTQEATYFQRAKRSLERAKCDFGMYSPQ